MSKREIISAVLFVLGMLLGLGAVGSLEFMGDTVGVDELRREMFKTIIAAVLMGASFPVAGKNAESEVDDDERT